MAPRRPTALTASASPSTLRPERSTTVATDAVVRPQPVRIVGPVATAPDTLPSTTTRGPDAEAGGDGRPHANWGPKQALPAQIVRPCRGGNAAEVEASVHGWSKAFEPSVERSTPHSPATRPPERARAHRRHARHLVRVDVV